MQELGLVQDDEIVSNGSIVRLYEVGRFDIIKNPLDKTDSNKKEMDFYEYMLVNCNVIKDNSFCLINITRDNVNRGSILCEFDEVNADKPLVALQLKKYFGNKTKVFVELNINK